MTKDEKLDEFMKCALPGFVDSKNEEKTERNAGYLVVSPVSYTHLDVYKRQLHERYCASI